MPSRYTSCHPRTGPFHSRSGRPSEPSMRVRHASSSSRDSGRDSSKPGVAAVPTRVRTTGPDQRRIGGERAEDAVDVVGGAGRARARELVVRRQQRVGQSAHDVVFVFGEVAEGHGRNIRRTGKVPRPPSTGRACPSSSVSSSRRRSAAGTSSVASRQRRADGGGARHRAGVRAARRVRRSRDRGRRSAWRRLRARRARRRAQRRRARLPLPGPGRRPRRRRRAGRGRRRRGHPGGVGAGVG